jgi:hypothetical protein
MGRSTCLSTPELTIFSPMSRIGIGKRRRVEPSEFKPYRASPETEIGGNQRRFTSMECSIHSGTTFTHHLWQLAQ